MRVGGLQVGTKILKVEGLGGILAPSWGLGAILAPSWEVCGPSWLQLGGFVGHLGSNLRVLEAIWEVLAENLEKPEGFQGFWGGPEFALDLGDGGAGGFCPRGVARGLSY